MTPTALQSRRADRQGGPFTTLRVARPARTTPQISSGGDEKPVKPETEPARGGDGSTQPGPGALCPAPQVPRHSSATAQDSDLSHNVQKADPHSTERHRALPRALCFIFLRKLHMRVVSLAWCHCPGLPSQKDTNEVASHSRNYCLTALETRRLKSGRQQG